MHYTICYGLSDPINTTYSGVDDCVQLRSTDWTNSERATWHIVDCCVNDNTQVVMCEKRMYDY